MDKNMNHDDIKKIVSETISNPDVLSFIVKQIQDQIEKEQSKVEQNKISESKTKNQINNLKSKADNYTSNNEYVNKYISERDKYMDVFKRVTETINEAKDNKETNKKEITQESSKKTWTQNTSHVSMMHNFSDGWYKWYQESTDKEFIGNVYFDLIRDENNNFDAFLNIYSVLNLYADGWENWEVDHYDNTLYNFPISKLEDTYTYIFTEEESKNIDSMEDTVHSYTHVEVDNELPMVSIYIMDYSKKTNKVYDFNRIIFTPSDDASENDVRLFYFDLYKYLSNISAIKNTLEDFCYTYINNYRIHGFKPIILTPEGYCQSMQKAILNLIDAKKKDGIKLTITRDDTPDKTNSILDKLGIPHDNGVVDIPISDDKFISNRIDSMNKAWTIDLNDTKEEEINNSPNTGDKSSTWSLIDTGYENYNAFLANAINDGFIKIEILSDNHIHLNINGTLVFMNNPYTAMDDRDTFGNKH